MTLLQLTSIVCITLFVLLGAFLITRQPLKQNGHALLGLFFLLLGLNFLDAHLLLAGFYLEYPQAALWEDPFALLFGPVLYFYSRRLAGHSLQLKAVLLHALPFLLLQLILLFYYHLGTAELRQLVLESTLQGEQPIQVFLTIVAILIHFFIYLALAHRTLKAHRKELEAHYSSLDITWFSQLLLFLLAVFMLSLLASLLQFAGPKSAAEIALLLVLLLMLVFIVRFLFKALRQPLFQPRTSSPGYTQDLDQQEVGLVKVRLLAAMEEARLFLKPELTIEELADHLDVSSRRLSQVINTVYDQNFYEFVNGYRIQEAQRILKESHDAKLTVLEVMYEVGFNSKSSFNTQFKRLVGMTPTEYRKRQS